MFKATHSIRIVLLGDTRAIGRRAVATMYLYMHYLNTRDIPNEVGRVSYFFDTHTENSTVKRYFRVV